MKQNITYQAFQQTNENEKNIVEVQNLTKRFGSYVAVDRLNLNIKPNSIFGFLGPNGAGKTTTIKLLLDLIYPSSGSIKLFGQESSRNSLSIRQRIGYLPQDPKFYPYMSVREILEFRAKFFFRDQKIRAQRVEESLELVGITSLANRKVSNLSGGERQRLGIAQAQINTPELIILDEPAAALDPMGRYDVLKIMENLQKTSTIFYSTHILDDVQKVSDTVAIVNKGQLVTQASIEDLLHLNQQEYIVKTRGNSDSISNSLQKNDWILNFNIQQELDYNLFKIQVSNEEKAEENLLDIFIKNNLKVLSFSKKQTELEEIFISLIGGK